uniref:Glycosyltransferase RgtA/B/C/D-like domain-containing protein n=1 Tax=Thermosporothrix sp. COM3 TaxID=2490863 RepID=A0A455STV7_9CHLR|nr:hypothetical protein KTC_42360 [Thermosporothrix sp. COM3]
MSSKAATKKKKLSIPRSITISQQWQHILFYGSAVLLLLIGLVMRLYHLDAPFDRDTYDEGVYWQTLRAMSAGHPLYKETFYSQTPFFILSVFPSYVLFGHSLWAARFGIVLISLLGLVGVFLIGRALAGRMGALVALFLLVTDQRYLAQSQTLQADVPCVAFAALAVGLALMWWEEPTGRRAYWYTIGCGISLALSLMSKLLTVGAVVPIGLLLLTFSWLQIRKKGPVKPKPFRPILFGLLACAATCLLLILPFLGSWPQFWDSVVSFHVVAGDALKQEHSKNFGAIRSLLTGFLTFPALIGAVIACLRKDWRVLPLIAWTLATIYVLWQQVPLFPHHYVAITVPLISLAVIGLAPAKWVLDLKQWQSALQITMAAMLVLVTLTAATNARPIRGYYKMQHGISRQDQQVINDLQRYTQRGQNVISDAQFLVALAGRDTPPDLVDTSSVRLTSHYLTTEMLQKEASKTEVKAVLFYTGRLILDKDSAFHTWVKQHYRLVKSYGQNKELWVKI